MVGFDVAAHFKILMLEYTLHGSLLPAKGLES